MSEWDLRPTKPMRLPHLLADILSIKAGWRATPAVLKDERVRLELVS
jgi:hypothetical protein